jgi:5-hydroxyisourate hydrolase
MAGKLTTHVLDTALGRPGRGVVIDLTRIGDDGARTEICSVTTNDDGRVDAPVLIGDAFTAGTYELLFHVADYYKKEMPEKTPLAFYGDVPIRFTVHDATQVRTPRAPPLIRCSRVTNCFVCASIFTCNVFTVSITRLASCENTALTISLRASL